MRIARFTHQHHTRLGVVDGDEVLDVGSFDTSLPTDVGVLLAGGGVAVFPQPVLMRSSPDTSWPTMSPCAIGSAPRQP